MSYSQVQANIATTGVDASMLGSRTAFTTSSNTVLSVVHDKENSQIKVYESNVARTTHTLKATLQITTTQGALNQTQVQITAAMFPDNSLGIAYLNSAMTVISYAKFTYGTSTFSAWETVASASYLNKCDITITEGGAPVIATYQSSNPSWVAGGATGPHDLKVYCKVLTGGVWTSLNGGTFRTISGNRFAAGCFSVGITTLAGTGATVRPVVLAFGDGLILTGAPYVSDNGVKVFTFTLNESTGAIGTVNTVAALSTCVGEAGTVSGSGFNADRLVRTFRNSATEVDVAVAHAGLNRRLMLARLSHAGNGVFTAAVSPSFSSFGYAVTSSAVAITHGTDAMNFMFLSTASNGNPNALANPAYINPTTLAVSWANPANPRYHLQQVFAAPGHPIALASSGDRNVSGPTHDQGWLYQVNNASPWNVCNYLNFQAIENAAIALTPSSGTTVTDSNPTLKAQANMYYQWPQAAARLRFQFATDNLFTTSLKDYLQDRSKLTWQSGPYGGNKITFTDTLPLFLYRLAQGLWYYRVAAVDEFGNQSAWSTTSSFTVAHAPSATIVSPVGNQLYTWNGGLIQLSWTFSDVSSDEAQSAYEIEVSDTSTGTAIYTSGKVSAATESALVTLTAATAKDKNLAWRVRVYDRDGVVGAWTALEYFRMSDPPTVSITSPGIGSTVSTGIPSVTLNFQTGGKTTAAYSVRISQGSKLIWSTSVTGVSLASGSSVTVTGDKSYLKNLQSYTISATVIDSYGMTSDANPTTFDTSWTPPAAPTGLAVDLTPYNTDGQGWVKVTWSDSARDPDFSGWVIYRKDEMVNAAGAVVQSGNFVEIGRMLTVSLGGYEYHDYLAPSGYKCTYLITQNVNRFGDQVESTNTTGVSVTPQSGGYWLIEKMATATSVPDAFRLANVTTDTFEEEWDETEYVVIGRGRHVDRGDNLGVKGSLTAQLRDSPTQSARQKRLALKAIKEENRQLWMRNPFGDLLRVSVGNIGITRIAGVGTSEFVDVTIPYSQVSE